jgi:hypothetical protein
MSEKETPSEKTPGVPFESDDASERKLWMELGDLPREMPAPRLRRRFYDELDRVSRRTRADRWRRWLGLNGVPGFLTALGCLVAGLAVGSIVNLPGRSDRGELSQLQRQVAVLNRNLILDRLDNDSASKRLLGVMEASGLAANDTEVARALLARAVDDRVYSVRSAAIDAIGAQLNKPAVGDELMGSLETTQSPLVQLALVDLVLRHGSADQLKHLVQLAERGALHPDVVQHVKSSVSRSRV